MPENWFNAVQPAAKLQFGMVGMVEIQAISDKSLGVVDDKIIPQDPQLSRIIRHNYVYLLSHDYLQLFQGCWNLL